MGADLYIKSINDRFDEEWRPRWQEACRIRDAKFERGSAACQGSPEQARVIAIFDEEFTKPVEEVGYFRDSYNDGNVFNYLGHSYWALGAGGGQNCFSKRPLINKQGFITPRNAGIIAERCTVEPEPVRDFFERKRKQYPNLYPKPMSKADEAEYTKFFREQQMRLVAFFRLAHDLGEPIYASV